jgi:hypothetical protein
MALTEIAQKLKDKGVPCNCDLDNWQPEQETGHSWVCRIHKMALKLHASLNRGAES